MPSSNRLGLLAVRIMEDLVVEGLDAAHGDIIRRCVGRERG